MTKAQQQARDDARTTLRALLPPGTTVYTIVRSVARSGMSRTIDCYKLSESGPRWLSGLIAKACGYRQAPGGALKVSGCGMDMGFAVVYELSQALYPDRFPCAGETCHIYHRPGEPVETHSGGYALKQEWM